MQCVKKKHDYSKVFDTLFWHALYVASMWAWYRNIFFRCYANLSLTESRILLFCFVLSSALIGYTIDSCFLKKKPHAFFNLLFGFGIYAAMTYVSIKPLLIIISISAALIISAAYSAWIICNKSKSTGDIRKPLGRRVRIAISSSKQIMSLGFLVIIAVIGVSVLFGGFLIKPTVYATKNVDSEEWTVSNKIEELSLFFDEERWASATLTTKLDTCQVLANICQAEWGTNELNVFASNTSDILYGYYNDQEHIILINIDYLMTASGHDVCETVVHEAYHALEYRMVDAYLAAPDEMKGLEIYQDAAIYMQEFENYQKGEDDYYAYANQLCEKHARLWADAVTYGIESTVNNYFGDQYGKD